MYQLLLICFLGWTTLSTCLAQSQPVDRLRAVLAKHPQTDTFRVHRLNELADALLVASRANGYDSLKVKQARATLDQALALAKRLGDRQGQARTLLNIVLQTLATSNYTLATPQKSRESLLQALRLAQLSGDKRLQLDIFSLLGSYNVDRTNALRYLQQAITLAKAWHMPDQESELLMSLGYYYGDNHIKSLPCFYSALKVAQKAQIIHLQATAQSAISGVFGRLGDYEQALTYATRAYQLWHQVGSKQQQKFALMLLGECYKQMGRYPQAVAIFHKLLSDSSWKGRQRYITLLYLADADERINNLADAFQHSHQALALASQYHINLFREQVFLTLGRAYQKTNQPDAALANGLKAFELAEQFRLTDRWQILSEASLLLASLYSQQHDYLKAYRYQHQHMICKDSLNNQEVARKATAMRFTEQMSRQQSQITLLQKDQQLQAQEARRQRQLLYTSLVILSLIGGLLVLLYRNNRQKQKANALLSDQKQQIELTLTELKATQAQLIQKEKLASLGELTAGIAHEIQNPLNFVNNFSEVSAELVDELKEEALAGHLKDVLAITDDLKQNVQKIHQHGDRASRIIKGMLEHSRTSTGERQPTDVNALVDEYLRLAYQSQRAKDKTFTCKLVTDFNADLGRLEVAPREMGRVFLNLFNNAFYAVAERARQASASEYQPTIWVSTKRLVNTVEIRVSDNGFGIPELVKGKIFQPFFTTKPTGEGTGLGLSISYDIVTKGHSGTLRVESQVGEGTMFFVELPQRQQSNFHA